LRSKGGGIRNFLLRLLYSVLTLSFLLWPQATVKAAPYWEQVGGNGLGDPNNTFIPTLETWGNAIYAGVGNYVAGARIYRSTDGNTWTKVNVDGFTHPALSAIMDFEPFGVQLYATTIDDTDVPAEAAEIWRSADGLTWTQSGGEGLDDANNTGFYQMAEYNGQLYAGSRNAAGGQLFSTADGIIWNQVAIAGLEASNTIIWSLQSFGGELWLGTSNQTDAAEVWRFNGAVWTKYFDYHDFGPPIDDYKVVNNFFNLDTLYWEAINFQTGAHIVERVTDDLLRGTVPGMGDPNNIWFSQDIVIAGSGFFFGTRNDTTPGELWFSPDGNSGIQIGNEIFNNPDNYAIYALTFKDYLYVGVSTVNNLKGLEIWRQRIDGNNFGITNKTLPQGTQGQPYSTQLSAAGGTKPYSYRLIKGVLPQGMELSSTGELKGTPQESGDFRFTVEVQDSGKKIAKAQRLFTLKIVAGADNNSILSQITELPRTGQD